MSKRKLLLADDSVTIQKVVNLTFADEGIEVISVGDGDSAMEKVAEIAPDLIMADVNMPGLTGYQICEIIRQDEKLRHIPVILLVGSFEPFDEEEALRVGADDFLTKPFQSIRQLVNKVTVLLNAGVSENGNLRVSGSLEDTLEMDTESLSTDSQTVKYDDNGFDDEMIETNQATSFAFDETQRFETRETSNLSESFTTQRIIDEELFEKTPPDFVEREEIVEEPHSEPFVKEPIQYERVSDEVEENEIPVDEIAESEIPADEVEESEITGAETAESEVSADEIEENEAVSEAVSEAENPADEILQDERQSEETKEAEITLEEAEITLEETKSLAEENIEEETIADEHQNDEAESVKTTQDDEMPLPEFASVLESDEDDILQLPPIESDFEDEDDDESSTEPLVATNLIVAPSTEVSEVNSSQFSPELIEMIANKVLEKLSEKAVKEVAWEVVPQMTELIVKKMAEEKLKE